MGGCVENAYANPNLIMDRVRKAAAAGGEENGIGCGDGRAAGRGAGRLGARREEEETDTAATAENRGRKKERKGSESHCRHFLCRRIGPDLNWSISHYCSG